MEKRLSHHPILDIPGSKTGSAPRSRSGCLSPILDIPGCETVPFYWNGEKLSGRKGEMVSSALFANGVTTFGHHHRNGSAQGIFCANGQCAQCTLIINGVPVKSCITALSENMVVESCEGLPKLPEVVEPPTFEPVETIHTGVLVIGGGPSGLSAAIELARSGAEVLLIDDKHKLGGKLVLQTHKFFGSIDDCYAGTRGIHIADKLEQELRALPNVYILLNTIALAVFSDRKVGAVQNGRYLLIEPERVIVATGAREKTLAFVGNTLPGVYGAGAFQTLVNRDLVKPTERLFIVGGGNVGLIAGYHALQAGIDVVGLVEALPQCGGYKVHADKLKRLGVPIFTSHTVLSANGTQRVESVTIGEIDRDFRPIPKTEKTFAVDTVLVAVGLTPVDIFLEKARKYGLDVIAAGDAMEIAEASSAMFSGKIAGKELARRMGLTTEAIPPEWQAKADILKSHPGKTLSNGHDREHTGVFPVLHCFQEIPCNPCTSVCPKDAIKIHDGGIMGLPKFTGECIGCEKCILICPGLAVTLVDFRKDPENALVTLPFELDPNLFKTGDRIPLTDTNGDFLTEADVTKVKLPRGRTQLITVKVPKALAQKVAGARVRKIEEGQSPVIDTSGPDNAFVCRCERVTVGEVRQAIRRGVTDLNELKTITRAGMGACTGSCEPLVLSIFRSEGIPLEKITSGTRRPIFVEGPLATFANTDGGEQ